MKLRSRVVPFGEGEARRFWLEVALSTGQRYSQLWAYVVGRFRRFHRFLLYSGV